MDLIRSEIYNRIYAELYDDIYAEVAANLSQARFDEIYAQVMDEVLDKVISGEITVTPLSIIEMVFAVAAEEADAVVGVTARGSGGTTISTGSGVIYKRVGDRYYVVTNNHVIEDAASVTIRTPDGEEYDRRSSAASTKRSTSR
ncbi:MAG: S1C family serine protease [Bacillus subtilis]|nr:S1C family serine protease [Bacillus subtilis]